MMMREEIALPRREPTERTRVQLYRAYPLRLDLLVYHPVHVPPPCCSVRTNSASTDRRSLRSGATGTEFLYSEAFIDLRQIFDPETGQYWNSLLEQMHQKLPFLPVND